MTFDGVNILHGSLPVIANRAQLGSLEVSEGGAIDHRRRPIDADVVNFFLPSVTDAQFSIDSYHCCATLAFDDTRIQPLFANSRRPEGS